MTTPMTKTVADKPMRLAVVVSNYGAAMHVGGGVDTEVRVFEFTPEAASYIRKMRQIGHTTITLAVEFSE